MSMIKKKANWFYLTIACVLFLLPFIIISLYNVSGSADDIFFAQYLPEMDYFEKAYYSYLNYNGRYFNALLFSIPSETLMSSWFAQLHPILNIFLMFFGVKYFIRQARVIKKSKVLELSLILLIIIFAFLPQIKTLYWFSGASVYVFPFSFLLFYLGFLLKDFQVNTSFIEKLTAILLIIAICGSNEIFMSYVVFLTAIHAVLCFWYHKNQKGFSLVLVFCSVFCSAVVITSLGTENRLEGEAYRTGEYLIGSVIGNLLPQVFEFFWKWLFEKGLIFIVALLGFSSKLFIEMPRKKWIFTARLLLVTTLCLICGGVLIVTFALGTTQPIYGRVLNSFFIIFLIPLIFIGLWLNSILPKHVKFNGHLIFFVGLTALVYAKSANIKNVYADLLENKAKVMQEESYWRFAYLKETPNEDVILPRLSKVPKTLMVPEWGDNPNAWTNKYLAQYANKSSVLVNQDLTIYDLKIERGDFGKVYFRKGFRMHIDEKGKRLVIKNETGNEALRFYFHVYPKTRDSLPLISRNHGFENRDFSWLRGKTYMYVNLPKYPIARMLIGQFNVERVWSLEIKYQDHVQ